MSTNRRNYRLTSHFVPFLGGRQHFRFFGDFPMYGTLPTFADKTRLSDLTLICIRFLACQIVQYCLAVCVTSISMPGVPARRSAKRSAMYTDRWCPPRQPNATCR